MRRLFFVVIASVAASLFSVSGASAQLLEPNGQRGFDPADLGLGDLDLLGPAALGTGVAVDGGVAVAPDDLGGASDLDPALLAQVQAAARSGDEAAVATLAENNPTFAASIAREAAKVNPGKAADFAKAVVEKVPAARADVQREVIAEVPSAKDAIETKVAEVPTTPTTGGDEEVVTGSIPDNNNNNNNDPVVIANNNAVENALQDTGEGSPILP
ncbi:hypothetical protein [Pyruvatibacter sp.]|uniref:hypothetical protein n=1 Tax=Pyruvatibacter sp. TaxID=1981328 RepID=UPI0032672333